MTRREIELPWRSNGVSLRQKRRVRSDNAVKTVVNRGMPTSPEPRRAVVIEDDPDIRGLLGRILTKQGFEVTEAEAGLPGIDAVRNTRADLVTLDLNLPDLD